MEEHPVRPLARIAAALCLAAPLVGADEIFAVRSDGVLLRVDTVTRTGTVVGPTGLPQIGGLAFGVDGTLYGIDVASDRLITIDVVTGLATPIGPAGAVAATVSTAGLANDPATDELYGVVSVGGTSSQIVRLDKATGVASVVGDTGVQYVVALGFDSAGNLWGVDGAEAADHLLRIDPATGAATVIGPQGLGAYPSIGALDVGPSGTLWALPAVAGGFELLRIDAQTGAATSLGLIAGISGIGLTGLALQTSPLFAAPPSISLAAGGTQTLTLNAGSDNAGRFYFVLGTLSGTTPGIVIDGFVVPLNVDAYTFQSLLAPNAPPFGNTLGLLDANGQATATVTLPPGLSPAFAGLRADHAYVVIDVAPTLVAVTLVSTPAALQLVP